MKAPKFSKEFFISRRRELLERLPENSVAFVISADDLPRNGDQTFVFRQNSDLYYLTGVEQEQTILVLCPSHPQEKFREVLFIRRSSPELETWIGHKLTKEEAREISGIQTIYWFDEFETYLAEFMYYSQDVFISVNENMKYQRFYNDAEYRFIERLRFLYPLHTYKRLGLFLVPMRLRKTAEELEVIKYAIELTGKAFLRVLRFIRPGVYEYQVEAEIIHEFVSNGVRSVAYQSIIASGENANVLHYIYNNKVCEDGDMLLMDFGSEYLNYAADLTRTVPVNGKFSSRQAEVYDAVYMVQRYMIEEFIRPGLTINQINEEADRQIADRLVDLGLIKESEKHVRDRVKAYYPHGLSHFMGLDVHDVGTKDTPLDEGMIITVEPGIYIKEEGLGVRLENDVLITDHGTKDLMNKIPLERQVIEDLMSK